MVPLVWSIAIILALSGLFVLWKSLIGARTATGVCASCGYDLAGLSSSACPECGRLTASTHRIRKRRPLLAPLGLLLILPAAILAFPRLTVRVMAFILPKTVLAATQSFGDFTVRSYKPFELPEWLCDGLRKFNIEYFGDVMDHRVAISGPNGFAFEHYDFRIDLGVTDRATNLPLGLNEDLDGDSTPDLLIESYSGGAHCCSTYIVLRLGNRPALIAQLHAENGAGFKRITLPDASTQTIITTTDDVWNYWNACYACSFKPEVILRLSQGALSLAPDLMATPPPSPSVIAENTQRMRALVPGADHILASDAGLEPAEFWRYPLELIYTGHESLAWSIIDSAWPGNSAEKLRFMTEFRANLKSSAYGQFLHAAFADTSPAPSRSPSTSPAN